MNTYDSATNYVQTKDFEEFLLVKWLIENGFENWIRENLLKNLEVVYMTWSNFSKSWELTKILSEWKKTLRRWRRLKN